MGRNALSAIANLEPHKVCRVLGTQMNCGMGRREFDGITDQMRRNKVRILARNTSEVQGLLI